MRLTVGPAADLRALLDYREDLVTERGALISRVHAELAGLCPGYQHHVPTLTTRSRIRQVLALIADDDSVRAAPDPAPPRAGPRHRRRGRRPHPRQITSLVTSSGSSLPQMYGVGPIVAARFLAEVVDIARYPNRNTFAAANGTAPIPASSGRTVRHRYNPGGNRQLNRVAVHDRDHPDPRRHRRPGLLRPQTRRRQDQPRSAALPQTQAVRPRLRHHARRRPAAAVEPGWVRPPQTRHG